MSRVSRQKAKKELKKIMKDTFKKGGTTMSLSDLENLDIDFSAYKEDLEEDATDLAMLNEMGLIDSNDPVGKIAEPMSPVVLEAAISRYEQELRIDAAKNNYVIERHDGMDFDIDNLQL